MYKLIGFENHFNQFLANYKFNKLNNCNLIYGSKGIGKRNFVNCLIVKLFENDLNKNNIEHHLNLFYNNTHPNIKIIKKELDIKKNKLKSEITIDQIRSLKLFLNQTSYMNNTNKIVIIDSIDDLNVNASNSFLKSLEEPKLNTFYFLISHQISKLLPTIKSRCIKFKFSNHFFDNFKKILLLTIENTNEEEIKFLFDITNGSPGEAIILHQSNITDLFDFTLDSLVENKNNFNYSNLITKVSKLQNDDFKNYLHLLKSILLTLNRMKYIKTNQDIYLSNKIIELKKYSGQVTTKYILKKLNFLSDNENIIFSFNLDKKLFINNFFTV